ncbi:hypothetical protein RB195_018250 [Necator americanus]|uniref:Uncharacterized protein n=1 Tax=Necator americanus TaxID=51031 RepID=A0ABR1CB29_NECAM
MRLLVLPAVEWPFGEVFYPILMLLPTIVLIMYIIFWCIWFFRSKETPQGQMMLVTPVIATSASGKPLPALVYPCTPVSNIAPPLREESENSKSSKSQKSNVLRQDQANFQKFHGSAMYTV